MTPGDDEFVPPPDDPFTSNDPAAIERERRRLQREAKRQQRSSRASLGERVSGALEGATAKGKESIEGAKERVSAPKEPPSEGAAPPSFRRAPAPRDVTPPSPVPPAPKPKEPPAPDSAPASVTKPPPATSAAPKPSPPTPPPPAAAPIDPVLHGETDDFAPPAPIAPGRRRPDTVEGDVHPQVAGARNGRSGSGSGSGSIWLRRGAALVALVVLAGGAAFAISRAGGEDPAPVQAGPAKLKTIDVTIPEGLARADMAAVAKDAGLKGDYEKETAKPPKSLDTKKLGFPDDVSLEGFLFPATYELEKGAPVKDLVNAQLEAFDENFSQVDMKAAAKKNLTPYDVVTIASMIEREVQVPEERELVSAVIYNRLADGETLGIDATLRYEVGFDKPLTESQLAADTPYNTRINPGLPPTPIGNPGLDSLKAAAAPADTDVKYYVFKPGTCGEHTFTADYDEFINLSNEYQAALEAEGGSPDTC